MSEKFIVEGGLSIPSGKFLELGGTELSASATELNLLDGMTSISTDVNLGTSDTILSTQNAVKSYVDAQLTGADLDISIGGSEFGIDLDSENITFAGTTNEVDVSAAEDENGNVTITYGLPSDVTIGQHLTVTGNLSAGANKLYIDGTQVTSTAAELNIVDGGTTATSTTVTAGDRVVYNDSGTMVQVDVDDIDTYFSATSKTLTNKTLTSPDINGGTIDDATIATSDITVGAGKTLDVSSGTLTLANDQISGDKVEGGTIAGITITSLSAGTADIDGGTIDGATIATSDITVGNSKTLNVSAGTLTTSTTQDLAILKSAAGVNDADIDFGNFEVRAQTFQSDEATAAPMTIASSALVSNLNADKVDGCDVVDEDDMASNSDTSVPTQQSVKKYVDDQLTSSALSAATESGNMSPIDLDSEVLTLSGGEGMNVTHSDNTVMFAAELATETNAGVATFDGTDFTVTDGDVTVKAERIEDIIGGMLGGASVQNGITVSYDDDNGELDFDVADPTITISGDVSGSATMTNLGDVTISVAQQANSVDLTTHTTGDYVATVTGGTGLTSTGAVSGEGVAHSLSVDANQNGNITSANSLVTVGALAGGSITSDFGNIDNGDSTLNTGAATVASMDVSNGGITQAGSIAGATSIDGTGDLSMGTITMTGFSVTNTGITTMLSGSQLSSDSASAVTADADVANKAYVDSVVTAADLDFTSDGNETLSIDLDSEVLDIAGGSNLTTSAAGNTITVALDNDVTITGDMTSGTITNAEFTVDANGNTDIDGTLDVASTVALAATGVATTVRGTLAVTEAATFTAQSVHNNGIDCNGTLSMGTNAIEGTADNMLLFADDSQNSATEHSFANDDDGVLALQAADHVRSLNDIVPNTDSAVDLGSSSKRWAEVHADKMAMEHSEKRDFSVAMTGSAVEVFNFTGHESCKAVIKVKDSSNNVTCKEILAVDGKIVEYATVSTGTEVSMTIACTGTSVTINSANGTAKGSIDLIS